MFAGRLVDEAGGVFDLFELKFVEITVLGIEIYDHRLGIFPLVLW